VADGLGVHSTRAATGTKKAAMITNDHCTVPVTWTDASTIMGLTNAPTPKAKWMSCMYGATRSPPCSQTSMTLPPVSRKPMARPCIATHSASSHTVPQKGIAAVPAVVTKRHADRRRLPGMRS
jgi:hypothetical protein